jgi:hypothetical protein
VHHLVLEDFIRAIEARQTRRDRLTAQIEAMLPDWTLAPVVAALETMRAWRWSMRRRRISRESLLRRTGSQSRSARYRRLVRTGKPANVVTTAIARELAGFVWAIARQVPPAAK